MWFLILFLVLGIGVDPLLMAQPLMAQTETTMEADDSLVFPELPPLTFAQRSRVGALGGFIFNFEQIYADPQSPISGNIIQADFTGEVFFRFLIKELMLRTLLKKVPEFG